MVPGRTEIVVARATAGRPPQASADAEERCGNEHRTDQQGVEQHAEGDGGPDLGEVDQGSLRESSEVGCRVAERLGRRRSTGA